MIIPSTSACVWTQKKSHLSINYSSTKDTYNEPEVVKGWTAERSEFESQYRQDFSNLHVFQTGSGAHQPHIQRVPATVVQQPGHEAH
jgi:hypothetical protein